MGATRTQIEDFWAQVNRQIGQHIADNAVTHTQVQVKVADGSWVQVQRPGNDVPDERWYPVMSPAYRPVAGDWCWALQTQGGLIVLGKNRQSGDMDIPAGVDNARSYALDRANDARSDAQSYAYDKAQDAKNAAISWADNNKSDKGHGHGSHSHSIDTAGSHSHDLPGSAGGGRTGSSGSHNHGGTNGAGV